MVGLRGDESLTVYSMEELRTQVLEERMLVRKGLVSEETNSPPPHPSYFSWARKIGRVG